MAAAGARAACQLGPCSAALLLSSPSNFRFLILANPANPSPAIMSGMTGHNDAVADEEEPYYHLGLYPHCGICADFIPKYERVRACMLATGLSLPCCHCFDPPSQCSGTRTRPRMQAIHAPSSFLSLVNSLPPSRSMAVGSAAVRTAAPAPLRQSASPFTRPASTSLPRDVWPRTPSAGSGS